MAYLGYEQQAVAALVLDVSSFTVPAKATHCEIQATTGTVRYTFDGTAPTTTTGMGLLITEPPKTILIQDLNAMKFIRNAALSCELNVHYFAGRDI